MNKIQYDLFFLLEVFAISWVIGLACKMPHDKNLTMSFIVIVTLFIATGMHNTIINTLFKKRK